MCSLRAATRSGLFWGLLGITAFSFTVPLTRVAVQHGAMSPLFVGSARAVLAAVLAVGALLLTRQKLPRSVQFVRLLVVAGGVVVGFPLLTSYALTAVPASHGAVVVAVLPAVTAVVVVLRTKEKPPRSFWVAASLGTIAAVAFAAVQGSGLDGLRLPDLLLLGSVAAAAIGYAEGGLLARELGAWQTVSWALVVSSPLMIILTWLSVAAHAPTGGPAEWSALAYLAVVSMFLSYFAWYRGLAIGPMASVSQVQLVQPILGVCWAVLLVRETVTWQTILGGFAVVASALAVMRIRVEQRRSPAGGIPQCGTGAPSIRTE